MIKTVAFILSILPLRINHLIGSIIGRILYLTKSKACSIVDKNIRLCLPYLPREEHEKLVRKNLIETGKNITECWLIWRNSISRNQKLIKATNGSHYLDSSRPTILLVPHFGCWELVAKAVTLYKPATFLYKELQDEEKNNFLLANRQKGDLTMVSGSKSGLLALSRQLKKSGVIGILPDQDPGENGGLIAPFLSQETRSMTLLVKMAKKYNANIILAWADRLDFGMGFELNFKHVGVLTNEGLLADVTAQNSVIEKLIKTNPEQYLWNYKRFRQNIKY